MKLRAAASLVLALAAVGGLAGCNLISPQATTLHYDPSDGVGVQVGDVEVRNAMLLVAPAEGELGAPVDVANFTFGLINHTGQAGTLTVSVTVDGKSAQATVDYPADEGIVHVGYGEQGQFLIEGVPLTAGSTVEVTFTGASGSTEQKLVPVLDGSIEPYGSYLPTVAPTTLPNATEPGATEPVVPEEPVSP